MNLITTPLWWIGILLTTLLGAIHGWLPVNVDWFHAVDVDDHLVSAGGYTAAAVALLGAATALSVFDGPPGAESFAVFASAVFTFGALRAGFVLSDVSLVAGWESFTDGVAGVWATPWAVFQLVAGVVAWLVFAARLVGERSTARRAPVSA